LRTLLSLCREKDSRELPKLQQISRPSYKASRNGSFRDCYSKRRNAVTGVKIANGTIWSSPNRYVTNVNLHVIHCRNPGIWLALCMDVIQHNIKQYGNCTVLLCKRISCFKYKNNIKLNAISPYHSANFKFLPSHATLKEKSVTSSTCAMELDLFKCQFLTTWG